MTDGVRVRRMVQSDFVPVTTLRRLLARQSHLERPDFFRSAPLDATEALFVLWLAEPQTVKLVATVGDRVAGYASAWIGHTWASDWMYSVHNAYIYELYVDEPYRRRSVGRALFEAIEAEATAQGAASVALNVNCANAGGRAFYECVGYSAQSETRSKTLRRVVRIERP
jgi:ribosomal protein S18 acetylase RimI-like enzyme